MTSAFSVICVLILVALVEGGRRFGREYDRTLVCQACKTDSGGVSLTKTDELYGPLHFLARPVLDMPVGPPSQGITTALGLCVVQADPQTTAHPNIDLHCPIWSCLYYHVAISAMQVSSNQIELNLKRKILTLVLQNVVL